MTGWLLFFRVPKNPAEPILVESLEKQLDMGESIFTESSKNTPGEPSARKYGCLGWRRIIWDRP